MSKGIEGLQGYRLHQSVNALMRLSTNMTEDEAKNCGEHTLECWYTGELIKKDLRLADEKLESE